MSISISVFAWNEQIIIEAGQQIYSIRVVVDKIQEKKNCLFADILAVFIWPDSSLKIWQIINSRSGRQKNKSMSDSIDFIFDFVQ